MSRKSNYLRRTAAVLLLTGLLVAGATGVAEAKANGVSHVTYFANGV